MIKLYKAILYIIYNMILKTIELNVTLSVVLLLMLRKFIYTKREKILFYTSILALLLLYTLSYYCIDFVHSFYVLIPLEYIFYIYNNNLQYNNLILFFICLKLTLSSVRSFLNAKTPRTDKTKILFSKKSI